MINRRTFIKQGSAATGAMLWGTQRAWGGANNRVRIAVVGIHGMGQTHIKEFAALPDVEVAAVCDVDENQFAPVIEKHFTKAGRAKPKTYTDIRKLLEDKDIDAITILTPNHWHALAAIWTMQAGKHVRIAKPCCHNIFEGRQLIAAAQKYSNVIVQDGCEQRSNPCAQTMAEFLQNGGLGEVYMAKGICYKSRPTIKHFADEPVPKGVDYDLWLGPAPQRPFNQNRFHYNWHWNWDYGNGDIGNQGVHEMDIARWGLGVKLPTKVCVMGGHFLFDDDQQTPNTLLALFEFPNPAGAGDKKKILQFEVRGLITNREGFSEGVKEGDNTYMTSDRNTVGNLFYGSKGYMAKNLNTWATYLGEKREVGPAGKGLGSHYAAFIRAIREMDPKATNTSIEEGFYSCALGHLANISYRLGRSLDFDPATLRFPHDEEANRLLTREYRAPFIVPEKV
jgi:predicted dehydrogenase